MEWMHGGGRDPHGRGLDEEIKIGKEDWLERQRVAQGGRIGLQSGQLVQPGPGRQGYQGKPHYKFSKWKKGVEGKAPMLKKDVREIAKEFKVKEKDFDSFEDFKTRVHSKKREEKRKEKLATDKKYYKKRIEQSRKYFKEMKEDPKRSAQRKATEQAYLDKQRETWNILKTERTPKGYLWRDLVENGLRYRKGSLKESHIQLKDARIKRPKSLDDILNVKLVDLNVLDKNGKPVVLTYDNFIEHIDKNQKRYGMSSKDILTEYDKKIFIHDNPELRDIFNKKMYKTYDPTNLASRRLHSPFHIHHTVGRGKNAFNVQFAEGPLNLKESYSRKSFNANWKGAQTLTEKKAAIKTYLDKRPEGLEVRLKKMPYGDRPPFKEQMSKFLKGKELNKIMKAYQTAGIGTKCSVYRAEGGRIGFAAGGYDDCMNNAIKEHNNKLQSDDLVVRNEARVKQFKINKTKGLKNILGVGRRGLQGVAGFIGGWGGAAIEAVVEGAFYEHARRQGYNHKQAMAETFLPKVFDRNRETGIWEGAEKLLEDELVGKRDEEGYLKSATPHQETWFNVPAAEYQDNLKALENIQGTIGNIQTELNAMKANPDYTTPEQILTKEQELEAALIEGESIANKLKVGTPEQEAYVRAEEKQKALQDERAQEHWGDTEAYKGSKQRQWQDEFLDYRGADRKYRKEQPFAFKGGVEANVGLTQDQLEQGMRIPWEEYFPRTIDTPRTTERQKWDYIMNQGGWDLMDKISAAGGVANMAEGGIASLKKK
jgi:hypothetical protein